MAKVSLSSKNVFQLTTLSLALMMAGCGDGGVDVVSPEADTSVSTDTSTSGNANTNTGNTTDTSVEETENLKVDRDQSGLFDSSLNKIKVLEPSGNNFQVRVINAQGKAVDGALVKFSIEGEGIELVQSTSGAVLTNDQGIASIFARPANAQVNGAYTIKAEITNQDNTASYSGVFEVKSTEAEKRVVVKEGEFVSKNGLTVASPELNGSYYRVRVVDAQGQPISKAQVSFAVDQAEGIYLEQPTSGLTITDQNGYAQILVRPVNASVNGAYSITATAKYQSDEAKTSTLFYVTAQPTNPANPNQTVGVSKIEVEAGKFYNTSGQSVSSPELSGSRYEVVIRDQSGNPVEGAKVNFAIDGEGVDLVQPTSGAVLTDSAGKASIVVKPKNAQSNGAYTITTTAAYEALSVSKSQNFSLTATNVKISELTLDKTKLESGEQANVTIKVTDDKGKEAPNTLVNLTASCGQIPTQMMSDNTGMVQVVYKAINADKTLCSGSVVINATTATGNSSQSANLTVTKLPANAISYSTTDEITLGTGDSGNLDPNQVKQLEFTVYANNAVQSGQEVVISLEKGSPADLSFGTQGNRDPITLKSDENGKVAVSIFPGRTPGPVVLKAALASKPGVYALSKNVKVQGSRPSQAGMSLSWEKNVLDWTKDGDAAILAVRQRDKFGNNVPDGTVVNFVAEGGKITPSCTTVNGTCGVTFTTQNPRPADGRVSILAYLEGEKDYIDSNNNNQWDSGESLVYNIGDTFRDDNENGTLDAGEFSYKQTQAGTSACKPTGSFYEKYSNYFVKSVAPNVENTCHTGLDGIVRQQTITLLSYSGVKPNVDNKSTKEGLSFAIYSGGLASDVKNPLPSGTTFSLEVEDKTEDNKKSCALDGQSIKDVGAVVSTGYDGKTPPPHDLSTNLLGYISGCDTGDVYKLTINTNNSEYGFIYKF